VRLLDFQVYARPSRLAGGEERPINEALFMTYEPVRLWLRDAIRMGDRGGIAIAMPGQK